MGRSTTTLLWPANGRYGGPPRGQLASAIRRAPSPGCPKGKHHRSHREAARQPGASSSILQNCRLERSCSCTGSGSPRRPKGEPPCVFASSTGAIVPRAAELITGRALLWDYRSGLHRGSADCVSAPAPGQTFGSRLQPRDGREMAPTVACCVSASQTLGSVGPMISWRRLVPALHVP